MKTKMCQSCLAKTMQELITNRMTLSYTTAHHLAQS